MQTSKAQTGFVILWLTLLGACAHQVEVITDPPGAIVTVNGKEIGAAPVTFDEERAGSSAEHIVSVRLNGYETTELRVLASKANPLALLAVVPLCGTLGWLGAVIPLVGGVALSPLTLGCSLLAGPGAAALLAGGGCLWMLLTAPTLAVLPRAQQLPDQIRLQLKPIPTFNQHNQGMSWPPTYYVAPDEDGYWQNPAPDDDTARQALPNEDQEPGDQDAGGKPSNPLDK